MAPVPQACPPQRRTATNALRAALYRDAVAIVRADFGRQLTLTEVSERLAASPRQLRRAFAEIGGTTFRACLCERRMSCATELLTDTELPVHEVAARVGYREPSQFAKAFRWAYGATPSAFRAAGSKRPASGSNRVGSIAFLVRDVYAFRGGQRGTQ